MNHIYFKNWLMQEAANIVRAFDSPVFLGKFSWWDVYDATKTKYLTDETTKQKVKTIFENSAYKMSSLGFPKMNSRCIIADLSSRKNHITGGGVAGSAYKQEHGIVVSNTNIDEAIIIHEHAHMFWFNLPKPNKTFFEKYYKEISSTLEIPKDILWNIEKKEIDSIISKKIDKFLESAFYNFLSDFSEKFFDISLHFEDYSDKKDDYILLKLKKPGQTLYGKLKKEITLSTYDYYSKKLNQNEEVSVFVGNSAFIIEKYIYNKNNYSARYEAETMNIDQVLEYVDLKINEKDLELINNFKRFINTDFYQIFASKNSEKDVFEILKKSLNQAFYNTYQYSAQYGSDSVSKHLKQHSFEEFFPYLERYFSSWKSLFRLRKNKIKNVDDLKKLFYDFVKTKLINKMVQPIDYNPSTDLISKNISTPQGSTIRNYISSKGKTVSPYGAANIDEIWATTVEHAAMNLNVSKELKRLIYQTINGF